MPKYKNITTFTRPLTVNGKRLIIKPNEILFSDRDLDVTIYDFLEKVDDKTATSQIKEIPSKQIVVPKSQELTKLQTKLEEMKKEVNTLQPIPKDITELNDKVNTILKRLEVMKEAVTQVDSIAQTANGLAQEALDSVNKTNQAVTDLATEVYENGSVIITGLDDEPENKG